MVKESYKPVLELVLRSFRFPETDMQFDPWAAASPSRFVPLRAFSEQLELGQIMPPGGSELWNCWGQRSRRHIPREYDPPGTAESERPGELRCIETKNLSVFDIRQTLNSFASRGTIWASW